MRMRQTHNAHLANFDVPSYCDSRLSTGQRLSLLGIVVHVCASTSPVAQLERATDFSIDEAIVAHVFTRLHTVAKRGISNDWLDIFIAQNHERINQTINSLIVCLHSGTEILLVELGEIFDAAVEGIGGPNLLRIWGDRQRVSLRGLDVHGARQGVTVDDERQAPSGDHVGAVEQAEVQVRTRGGPGVPQLRQRRSGGDDIAYFHGDAARLQVRIDGEHVRGQPQDHLIPAEVGGLGGLHGLSGWRIRRSRR